MKRPDVGGMIIARAAFDSAINKALSFVAPADGIVPEITTSGMEFVTARIKIARKALDDFEDAAKGGGE